MTNMCDGQIRRGKLTDLTFSVIDTLALEKNVKARLAKLVSIRSHLHCVIQTTLDELQEVTDDIDQ